MKRIVLSFFFLIFIVATSAAQVKQVDKKNNALAIGLYTPIGDFGESHVIGIGAEYRFIPFRQPNDSSDAKQIAFVIIGGIHYYFGKNIVVNSYEFDFGNFFDIHLKPGLIYLPFKRSIIQLSAGPAANLYKQNIRVGVGTDLFTSYYLIEKISVGPAIHFRKFSNTTALWSAGITANYFF